MPATDRREVVRQTPSPWASRPAEIACREPRRRPAASTPEAARCRLFLVRAFALAGEDTVVRRATPQRRHCAPSSGGRGTLTEKLLGQLEGRDRLLARDAREVIQEGVQGVARFQVLHQSLDGDPGTSEDGRSTEDGWVGMDDVLCTHDGRLAEKHSTSGSAGRRRSRSPREVEPRRRSPGRLGRPWHDVR